jgi:hypothetical protein
MMLLVNKDLESNKQKQLKIAKKLPVTTINR